MGIFGGRSHGKSPGASAKAARASLDGFPPRADETHKQSIPSSPVSSPGTPSNEITGEPNLRTRRTVAPLSPKTFRNLLGTPRTKPRKTKDAFGASRIESTEEKTQADEEPEPTPVSTSLDSPSILSSRAAANEATAIDATLPDGETSRSEVPRTTGFLGVRNHGKSPSSSAKAAPESLEDFPPIADETSQQSQLFSALPSTGVPSNEAISSVKFRTRKSHASLSPKSFRLLLGAPRSRSRKTKDIFAASHLGSMEEHKQDDESPTVIHHSVEGIPSLSSRAAAIHARTMEAAAAEAQRSEVAAEEAQRSEAAVRVASASLHKNSDDGEVEGPPPQLALPDRQENEKSPKPSPKSITLENGGSSPAGSVEPVHLSEHWMIDHSAIILGKTIGHSSFGMVNEGRLNGTKVAVKTISRDPKNKKDGDIEAFKKEAELNCKLRHPNIVLYMGICVQPTEVCIVTELMARGNVHELLVTPIKGKSVKLDWSLRLQWAIDTAQGMAYLHSLNPPMIHRDLKTTNLLVDRGMNVKICDFGLSRFQAEDKVMSAVGTVQFAAPEVLRHEKYTEKADLFSYGTVLWELYTRKTIFQGLPQIAIYKSVVDGEMPPVGDGCDPRYAKLVQDCWQLDAMKRPSFRDVLDRLAPLSDELCTDYDV